MWKDFYYIQLYHDTEHAMGVTTYDTHEKYMLEAQARNYYKQLRAMGAKGEIRIIFQYRDERKFLHSKQIAFVSLHEPTFKYVETP